MIALKVDAPLRLRTGLAADSPVADLGLATGRPNGGRLADRRVGSLSGRIFGDGSLALGLLRGGACPARASRRWRKRLLMRHFRTDDAGAGQLLLRAEERL